MYTRLLDWAMAHRGHRRGAAVLVLLSSVPLVPARQRSTSSPQDDESQFEVSVRAPEGTSLEATDVMANRIAHGHPPDSRGGLHAGHRRRGDGAGTQNIANVFVKLKPIEARNATSSQVDGGRPRARSCRARSSRQGRFAASVGAGGGAGRRRRRSSSSSRVRS